MSKLRNILPVVIGLMLIGSSLWAFGPAPTPAPNCDPATVPGCNPPINVGVTAQIKNGSLGLGGNFGLSKGAFIDFNSTVAGRSSSAVEGKIKYDTNNLIVYGGGVSPTRKVTIYDQLCGPNTKGEIVCRLVGDLVGANGSDGTNGASGLYGRIEGLLTDDGVTRTQDVYNVGCNNSAGAIEPGYCRSGKPACRSGYKLVLVGRSDGTFEESNFKYSYGPGSGGVRLIFSCSKS